MPLTLDRLKEQVVGIHEKVLLLDGTKQVYINFDNAASTPTFIPVQKKVDEFCRWYSNVHRGTGFKSKLSSWVFDEGRKIIARFVKADASKAVIFCKNATEAINRLARRFHCPAIGPEDKPVILTTVMEHHSNELPWRQAGNVVHVSLTNDGRVDMNDMHHKLDAYRGKVCLVAVTGASNVTGFINPIHDIARKAHAVGAQIAVDAAQLVPHRPIDMKSRDNPEHLDYLAFSAHKIYAPYGIGVLVAEPDIFAFGSPENVGGGVVDIVDLENAYWKDLPDREEAGTPDIVGVVALAKVILLLEEIGFDSIIEHEAELTAYALEKLQKMPEVVVYGDSDPHGAHDRLGVISLNVRGVDHALVSAILSYEGGIGVRNGCFCAHPYVKCLLNVTAQEAKKVEERIIARDRSEIPGTVRISFGLYNTKKEIDHLCNMLQIIIDKKYKGKYEVNKERGEYAPIGFQIHFDVFFKL
jgi:cysteine desulfurase/selenocysteine lyase